MVKRVLDVLEETVNRSSGAMFGALLIMLCGIGLAGVMFVQGSPCPEGGQACSNDALQRLGLLFGLLGLAAPSLVAALKSDQAANKLTNGGLQDEVRRAILAASGERRHYDPETAPEPTPPAPAEPGG